MGIRNRQQVLAVLAIAAVALWAGDQLILSPLTRVWKERSARIGELKKAVKDASLLAAREPAIRRRWEGMKTNTLPANASAAENVVLKAFERWSQESRVSITSIKPQWKRADDDYLTLECRADAFGSIAAVTRFLFEMEKDPLALKLTSLEITARDAEGQQLALGVMVSGLLLGEPQP